MNLNRTIKISLILAGVSLAIGSAVAFYAFYMPHRDVQATQTDYKLEASQIVVEYLTDAVKANQKYLDSDGESKILEVTGTIFKVSDDFQGNKVVLLKSENDKAGVSCTFSTETNSKVNDLHIRDNIIVKGVIRSGASYDEDLGMYEDVIMEKCDLNSKM